MCPPDVRRAKRLKELIRDKAEIDSAEGEVIFEPPVVDNQLDGQIGVQQPPQAAVEEVSVEEEVEVLAGIENQENRVAGNLPTQNQRPARPNRVTLSPIPPNITTVSQIASNRRENKKRAATDDLVECYKLKFMQKEEETKSNQLRWEQEKEANLIRWEQERQDKAAQLEAEFQRMRVEAELRRDEEERRYRREAAARAEERQAKEAARAEERKIEADERKREAEEARAFREVMMWLRRRNYDSSGKAEILVKFPQLRYLVVKFWGRRMVHIPVVRIRFIYQHLFYRYTN